MTNGTPSDPLNGIFKVLGELEADVRTIKHSQNGASMKLDVIGTVVAQVEDLNNARTDHEKRLHTLEDESQRRQGAVNLFSWLARHWPFTLVIAAGIALWHWLAGHP